MYVLAAHSWLESEWRSRAEPGTGPSPSRYSSPPRRTRSGKARSPEENCSSTSYSFWPARYLGEETTVNNNNNNNHSQQRQQQEQEHKTPMKTLLSISLRSNARQSHICIMSNTVVIYRQNRGYMIKGEGSPRQLDNLNVEVTQPVVKL